MQADAIVTEYSWPFHIGLLGAIRNIVRGPPPDRATCRQANPLKIGSLAAVEAFMLGLDVAS
jgi:hypothetical protein